MHEGIKEKPSTIEVQKPAAGFCHGVDPVSDTLSLKIWCVVPKLGRLRPGYATLTFKLIDLIQVELTILIHKSLVYSCLQKIIKYGTPSAMI